MACTASAASQQGLPGQSCGRRLLRDSGAVGLLDVLLHGTLVLGEISGDADATLTASYALDLRQNREQMTGPRRTGRTSRADGAEAGPSAASA